MPDTPRKLRVIDTPDPERPPAEPEAPREKLRLGNKEFTAVNRAQEASTNPITVHEILASNLKKPGAEKPLDLRRRLSRRKRDYWLCVGIANGLFALAYFWLPRDPMIRTAIVSAAVLFTLFISWIMWQVMSDY